MLMFAMLRRHQRHIVNQALQLLHANTLIIIIGVSLSKPSINRVTTAHVRRKMMCVCVCACVCVYMCMCE